MSNPMPGWYPDPEAPERQRFWDGNKWTEARAYPVAGGDPNMPGAQHSTAVPDEKRKSNPWVVIALVAILAALLFFFAWFFLLRDSGTTTEPITPPTAPVPTPPQPTAPAPAPTTPTPPVPPTPTPDVS